MGRFDARERAGSTCHQPPLPGQPLGFVLVLIQTFCCERAGAVSQFAERNPLVKWMARNAPSDIATRARERTKRARASLQSPQPYGVTMSAVRQGTQFALCAGFLMLAACGSSAPAEDGAGAGSGAPLVDNFPSANAGQSSGNGFKAWQRDASGAGAGGAAGLTGTAGSAGAAGVAAAAGSGGTAGSAGAAGASAGTGGAAASSDAVEPDPLDVFGLGSAGAGAEDPLDLFGEAGAPSAADSCSGLVCLDHADCRDLYPEQNTKCRFTRCEEFECK